MHRVWLLMWSVGSWATAGAEGNWAHDPWAGELRRVESDDFRSYVVLACNTETGLVEMVQIDVAIPQPLYNSTSGLFKCEQFSDPSYFVYFAKEPNFRLGVITDTKIRIFNQRSTNCQSDVGPVNKPIIVETAIDKETRDMTYLTFYGKNTKFDALGICNGRTPRLAPVDNEDEYPWKDMQSCFSHTESVCFMEESKSFMRFAKDKLVTKAEEKNPLYAKMNTGFVRICKSGVCTTVVVRKGDQPSTYVPPNFVRTLPVDLDKYDPIYLQLPVISKHDAFLQRRGTKPKAVDVETLVVDRDMTEKLDELFCQNMDPATCGYKIADWKELDGQ